MKITVTLEFDLEDKVLDMSEDDILDNFEDYYKNHMSDQQKYDPAIKDSKIHITKEETNE